MCSCLLCSHFSCPGSLGSAHACSCHRCGAVGLLRALPLGSSMLSVEQDKVGVLQDALGTPNCPAVRLGRQGGSLQRRKVPRNTASNPRLQRGPGSKPGEDECGCTCPELGSALQHDARHRCRARGSGAARGQAEEAGASQELEQKGRIKGNQSEKWLRKTTCLSVTLGIWPVGFRGLFLAGFLVFFSLW